MAPASQAIYEFGPFRLDPPQHVLLQDGRAIPLPPKAFEILVLLLERRGALMSKQELQERVWPDTYVDENNLAQQISLLRRFLDEDAEDPRYIETVPRVGYRFVAETRVTASGDNGRAPGVESWHPPAVEPSIAGYASAGREVERDGGHEFSGARALFRGKTLAVLAAIAVISAASLSFWYRPTNVPSVLNAVQLTHDGYAKRGRVFADGEFVYLTEVREGVDTLVRVPGRGGEAAPLFGTAVGMVPVDLSPRRGEILALGQPGVGATGTAADSSLWTCPLPSGPFRRVGALVAGTAAWSPDGSQIFFSQGTSLWLAKSDGSEARELLALPGRPAWLGVSPNGRFLRLRLQHETGRAQELWEVRADGSRLHQISLGGSAEAEVSTGAWTHDGRYFLFGESGEGRESLWALREAALPFRRETRARLNTGLLSISGVTGGPEDGRAFGIGKLDRVEVLRYDVKSGAISPYLAGASGDGLAFSRDGNWVAYTSFPERALVRSRANGSERRELTDGNRTALLPAWSPDGKRIAYMERAQAGPWKIHLVSSEGGTPEELLAGNDDEGNPTWSPDGNLLIFSGVPWEHGFAAQSTAIREVDLRTRRVETLPDSAGLWSPRWAPDGKYVVAETIDSKSLVLYDFAERRWLPLASAPEGTIGYTSWSHDSRYVYYNTYAGQRGTIYRADRVRRASERVSLAESVVAGVTLGQWFALAPDDSPLLLRDTSVRELFALDLRLP